MRSLKFVEPNYKCKVSGPSGDTYDVWLLYAASEEELRERLQAEVLKPLEVEDYDFNDWKIRAQRERLLAEAARDDATYVFKKTLWSEVKQFLFSLSKNKCGYCEANVKVVSSGHVEHYRPKRRVEEDPTHPGYYWLAYDISNYVPCCENCNSVRGKRNHFPLSPGSRRATKPSDVVTEQALLLNPFDSDPAAHLRFVGPENGDRFGQIEGLTCEGEESARIYNLNRHDLVLARRESYNILRQRLDLAQAKSHATEDFKNRIVNEILNGKCEFSIMVKPVVMEWLNNRSTDTEKKIAEAELLLESLSNDLKMLTTS